MSRTKFYTVDELIASYAAQPIEERTKRAVVVDHPGRASIVRMVMSFEGMYPESEYHNERTYALDKAELHRFVDALAEVDLRAMHKLAATLIREPIHPDIYDTAKRKNARDLAEAEATIAEQKQQKRAETRKAKALATVSK